MKQEITRSVRVSLLAVLGAVIGSSQVSVLTQHNDNARTGQNLNETILNTSNVNQNSFGKLFWRTIDGFIYAQPLYIQGLTIAGATHNVVYVATQHNSVYAFDADDPGAATPLWQVNLGTPVPSQDICILTGDTNPDDCPYYDISPEIGITSTPVIDPVAGIIYVVNRTKNTSNSTYHDYLHALNITTGVEELSGPVEIVAQVSGTAPGSVGGVLTFNPAYQNQRPSLLLLNGYIYIGFGSVGDIGTYHGWVMSYNASTLQQEAVFGVAPDGNEAGVWAAGQGPVADAAGNVYVMTANGDFNVNTGGVDYGDSFLKFSGPSLAVADYFTPDTQGTLNAENIDLGSGGPMLMPGTSLLVGMGKDTIFRVVNTTDMGKYNSGVDNDVQEFTATTNQYYSSPVYWNSPNNGPVVYIWGSADYLKAFAFKGSLFNTTPVSQSTIQNSTGQTNSAPLSVSANGSQLGSGIVWAPASISEWASGVQVPGVLRAFDATDLATELWDSTQNSIRDNLGNFAKFDPPTIANGKVYAPSFSGQLQVYGLNPPPFQGIQFVQVASDTPQSTTATVAAAYSGAQTAGDLNVVIIGWNDATATVKSVTDSAGNTYALAAGPTTGTGLSQSIYYAKNITGSSNNTVTVAFNEAATKPDLRVLEYSGVNTASPLDISAGASGNSNVADSGFATTTAANELVVGGNMAISNTVIMAGAPFSPRVITTTDSDVAEDRLVNVAGNYHAWAPLNASGNWVMQMVTFRAIVSGTAPVVSNVSPSSGLPAGGTAVTVTGTNFALGATVTFGGTAATNVVVVNSGTITATTPAGAAGAVAVTVTNPSTQNGSLANGFTYTSQPGPTVSNVSPNTGPVAGGTAVTITGTNFVAGATVKFGSTAATNVVVVSATSITATTPAGSAGAVTVTVTVNGLSGSLPNGFTYTGTVAIAFSQVASATPQTATASVPVSYPAAQTAGDLNVVVVGWNDNTSTVQSVKDSAGNSYSLAVGPTVGTGLEQSIYYAANIVGGSNTVTVTFSQAAAYPDIRILEYRGVTALDVTAGASGSSTAANSGSATTTSANELVFGANTVATGNETVGSGFTSRIITSPDGDLAEDKIVTAAGSNSATATLSGSGPWVMQMATFEAVSGPVPTVSSVGPSSGTTAGGTAVTITGTNFVAGATVTFGGTAATSVVVVSSTSITATTPAGAAGAVTVTVSNPGGQSGSLANAFTYIAPPTVSSISPANGTTAGGTAVTITGTNFATGATVKFGSTAATNVVVVSATSITATTPAGSAGAVTVTVTLNTSGRGDSDGLSGSLVNGFTYVGAPTVSSVSPNSGTTAGGTAVTITGTNFVAGATVTFGGVAATSVVVVSSTSITATTPAGTAGAVTVTVTVSGQSGSLASGFTYVTAPTVSSVSPNTGPVAGGTAVTITGTNFATGATVKFGSTAATNVVVVSATSITATTPAGSAGAVTVTVTVNAQSGSLANGFTYVATPTVSSVSPNSGTTAGGTAVTITGTNFVAGATVKFGSTAATNVVVVSATSITATTPAGSAGAVTVTVTVNGLSGSLPNGFTYTGTVAIAFSQVASATPQTATASVPVSYPAAQTAGDLNVVVVGWSDNTSTVQSVKDSAGNSYSLAVGPTVGTGLEQSIYYAANIVGGSNTVTVTFSQAAAYPDIRILEYRGVTALDVTAGASGSSTAANSGSATTTSANELVFGANTVATGNETVGSGFTSRIITSPDGDLAEDKIVTAAGSNSATATLSGSGPWVMQMATFEAVSGPVPTVSSVGPSSGTTAGGTAVTITGTNFVAGATVTFGGTAATSVVVVSSTSITATTPAGAAGAVTVTVSNPGGQSGSLANAFTYIAPPTVSSISPANGTTAGGTAVTITGTNFATGATVKFGSTAATNVVVVSATSITATTPAGSAGAVTVTVTNSNGLSGSLVSGFTYIATPTVSSVSPNSGTTAGGTAVTITGTNFVAGATVTFGGVAATSVVVVSSTSITATTPAGTAGAVTVTVTVSGQSGSLASGFTYVTAPTVSSVSPNTGPVAGGTAVTITGTNFATGATVKFGSTAATNVVVVSATSITATTPAGSAGAVTVTVTVNAQSGSLANGFTYVATPTVSSVSPNSGTTAGGTAVTITGTNFATGATVKFGSTAATNVVVVSATSITATTPAGSAGAVTVTVTVNGLSGSLPNGFTYTGTVAIAFSQVASATPQTATASVPVSYPAAQTAGDLNVVVVGWNDNTSTVQSVKDSAGNSYSLAVGPTVGTGLEQSIYYAANIVGGSNTVTVTFSQAAAYPDIRILEYRGVTALDVTAGASGSSTAANSGSATTTSANELVFGANTVATGNETVGSGFTSRIITSPDGDLAEDKIVTAAGSNSATATLSGSGPWVMQMATFEAVSGPVPTVSSVGPSSGTTAGGTAVTITGTNFVAGATVTFGGTAATSVVVVSSTSITATTPAGAAGAVTVTVSNPGGQSGSLANAFTYIAPPTVSSISPANGTTAGGTAVTITGTNFATGATVKFGSTAATNVVVVSATSITATTPAGSAGAVTVTVTNSNGLSGSLASGFTYIATPTVSSVSPNSGTTAGGTAVTITGTNFVAGATVTFGGVAATSVVVVSGTSITATTPAGTAGAVTVTVTVSGQSGSLASGYTYIVTGAPTAPGNFVGALVGASVPTYVAGQEYYNATAGTSFTSASFNSTGADLLIMFLGCHNHTVFSITDSYGNTWLPLAGSAYKVGTSGYPMEGEFFYAPNASTGTGHTITVGLSQSEPLVMSISALSGDNVYSPIDTYTSILGDNGTLAKYVNSSFLTTSQPDDLLLGIVKGFGNNTYGAGTGFTEQSASTGLNFAAEIAPAASPGSYNSSFTASVGDFWQSVTAAIAPKPTQTALSWTPSTGGLIANYLIERCAGLSCSGFSQIASVSGSTLTYTDASISAGTVYSYRVRAESSGIFGPYSTVQPVSPIVPQVVSSFASTPTGGLAWTQSAESGGSISQYSVERCTGVGCAGFSPIATTVNTSYLDTSAVAGTTYNYRVRAQDANGFYGPYSAVTTASIPAYFDNAADGGNNGGGTTSLTYSYTVGTQSNRLLLVNIVGDTSADDISSVKYAGASLVLLTKVQTPGDRWHYLYYLLAPQSGTNGVVVTAASPHYLISEAASWYNITQSGPVAFTTNTASNTTNSVSITTSLPASPNNVVVAESMWGSTGLLPDNGSASLVVDAAFDALGMFSSVPSPVTQAFPASMKNTWGGQSSASTIMAEFALASNGTAGITYDNSADGGNNDGTTETLTYAYTVGTGANRLLVVNLVGDTMADNIASVTYAGAPLTLLGKIQAPSNNNWQYLYYLLNPASGTNSVVVTAGTQHYLISEAASWYNVRQSAQPDAITTNTASAGSTAITTSLTTVAAGSLVVQGLWSYGHLAEGVGATQILVDSAIGGAGIFVSNGSPVSPAGSVSMTTISDGTQSTGVMMASFAPVP